MQTKLININIPHRWREDCKQRGAKLSDLLTRCTLKLLFKQQRNKAANEPLYGNVIYKKQAATKFEKYDKIAYRMPLVAWEWCEMMCIKKSVLVNEALNIYGQTTLEELIYDTEEAERQEGGL